MLAIAWPWNEGGTGTHQRLAARLGSSLCGGIGGNAGTTEIDGVHFAYRPLRLEAALARTWRPTRLPSGRLVVFHGYFDNLEEIATALDARSMDAARLYGVAVETWGEEAERRIIGDYCAVIADPKTSRLRLSRSPLRAPPLYYHHDERLTAAASVPRALFAAGVEQRLNEDYIGDSSFLNFSDEEETAFDDVAKVPKGAVVELDRGRPRILRKWYDLRDIPELKVDSDEAVLARVSELLNEGVRACVAGFRRPGATLSGGLDTPQVAVRALAALPPEQKLPTFTFHPGDEFDGCAPPWMMGNERPLVEAFAALHPRLEPHFTSNEGYEQDYRLNELFHLVGGVPPYVGTMYVFHGIFSEASKHGCDGLLLAQFGNQTFSDQGDCGFVEYFLKGRWRQLWLALTRPPIHRGSVLERFVVRTLSAFVPASIWSLTRRYLVPRRGPLIDVVTPLSNAYRVSSGADKRLRKSGYFPGRYQPWSRRQSRRFLFANDDWLLDVYQGFEQMYGVATRDPTAYRPFVEYCLGLPTRMFMRDGELRWLAKRMAKGLMPEDQRLNPLKGWWDADWHVRIGRRRAEWLAELNRLQEDERFAGMFDFPRLRSALEDWPAETEIDPRKFSGPQMAVPAAIVTARFIKYIEARNTP